MLMITKPHAFHHNPFKMTNHLLGQENCTYLLIDCHIKISLAYEALIATRARDSHNILLINDNIKLTASTLIFIDHSRGETSFPGGYAMPLAGISSRQHLDAID